jgi:uncharacterized membrane protein
VESPDRAPATLSGGPSRLDVVRTRAIAHLRENRIPYAVAALTFAVYMVLSVRRYQLLQSPSWDLGIFDQAIRNMAAGHAPTVLIKGVGYDIFGDHFHPVIALLVPVYWLFPTAMSLLVVQNLLVAASAFVVTRLAVEITGAYAGTALGLTYAASWGLQAAVAAQFHEVAFALPLLAASLAALVRRRFEACAWWAVPLVFVKEDLGLTVAVIGLLIAWRSRGSRGRLGALLAAWGIAGFVVAVKLVLPAINSQGVWDYQSQLPWSTLTNPGALVSSFVQPTEKLSTLAWVFGITGFLALRSPIALATLPTFGWRFLADLPAYWGTGWHYSAVLMPIVAVALLDAVVTLRERPARFDLALLRRYATVAAPICAAVAVVLTVEQRLPLTDVVRPSFYTTPERVTVAHQIMDRIPAGTSVESDAGLLDYLTADHDVYWMGRPGNPSPDFLLVDARNGGWNTPPSDVVSYAEQLHPGTTWTTLADEDGYTLLRRSPG